MLQRANHRSHLMMKKGPRACVNLDEIVAPDDIEPVERPHRAFGLTFSIAEVRKIVPPDTDLRSSMHGSSFKLTLNEPGPPGFERKRRPAVDDTVNIVPASCGKPRVKRLGNRLG